MPRSRLKKHRRRAPSKLWVSSERCFFFCLSASVYFETYYRHCHYSTTSTTPRRVPLPCCRSISDAWHARIADGRRAEATLGCGAAGWRFFDVVFCASLRNARLVARSRAKPLFLEHFIANGGQGKLLRTNLPLTRAVSSEIRARTECAQEKERTPNRTQSPGPRTRLARRDVSLRRAGTPFDWRSIFAPCDHGHQYAA